eukprot:TRINITY_DN736_c0_g1_i2.p1 TRINITY_DN736_c0_g1~~TRINITY_DN736_c0_g1_i2.p1  ORF type:complete len:151 (-),score=91.41 TRINITY_DN736_c0_g1_i2:1497-1949(-)
MDSMQVGHKRKVEEENDEEEEEEESKEERETNEKIEIANEMKGIVKEREMERNRIKGEGREEEKMRIKSIERRLKEEELNEMMKMMNENMRDLYIQSKWGWNQSKKRKELNVSSNRFLFLFNVHPSPSSLIAFISFDFSNEEMNRPSIYW